MFPAVCHGNPNYPERLARRDGAYTVLHRDAAPAREAPVWTPLGGARVEALPRDGALTRRRFLFADVPAGGDPVRGRLALLFNDHVALAWVSADSESPTTVLIDHDGDQVVCVLEGGATLDTPCGTLRANAAEHVFIPRGMPHRWRVDKLGLRALVVEVRGELTVPRAHRNDYGQPTVDAPFGHRDLNLAAWFARPGGTPAPTPCTLRRGGRTYDGSVPNNPLATVGYEGSVYPASIAWEAPFVRPRARGVDLFVHERFALHTCLTRDDGPPVDEACELATLALDGDGAASLTWEPLGVPPTPAGTPGGIVVQVRARDALTLAPDGVLLMDR